MFSIRKATAKDAPEIQKVLNTSWFTTYKNIFTADELDIITSKWHKLEKIKNQIAGNEYVYLVAEEDKNIVGVCSAVMKENNVVALEKLHILPGYKGKGIGSALLEETLRVFKDAKLAELEVIRQNTYGIGFYEKKGFKKIKEMEFIVKGVKIACNVMEKHIA